MTDRSYDILRKNGVFRNLSERWLRVLAENAVVRRFPRGASLFRQGEEELGFYCIEDGLVRVFKLASSGKELVLHFADAGKTVGEVAVMGGFPAPAHAEALADTTCAVIPGGQFRALLEQHPELALSMMRGMALWVRDLVDLLEDLVLRDATGRVARRLMLAFRGQTTKSGNAATEVFQLPVLKKDLAAHLNLTSETLSRTLRRLAERGYIELDRNGVRLLDEEGLDAVSLGDTAQGPDPK